MTILRRNIVFSVLTSWRGNALFPIHLVKFELRRSPGVLLGLSLYLIENAASFVKTGRVNVCRSSRKICYFCAYSTKRRNVTINFSTNRKCEISWKPAGCVSHFCTRTDERADGHGEASSRFLQLFCERTWKWVEPYLHSRICLCSALFRPKYRDRFTAHYVCGCAYACYLCSTRIKLVEISSGKCSKHPLSKFPNLNGWKSSRKRVVVIAKEGCTNSQRHVALVTKFCTVVPNICRPSVWNGLYVITSAPRILKLLPNFCKIDASLY
jgi:hypothetical protein